VSAPPLRSTAGVTVLTIGDVMLDEYVWGEVQRISPEAPVPVVQVQRRTHVPGGAANAAAGVVALGGRALLGGVVGADVHAEHLREALAEKNLAADGLVVDPSRPTTTKTRVIAHSQQVVRTDAEDRSPLPAELEAALADWAGAHLPEVDSVVLSDYAKGVVSPTLARRVIELARDHGKPVVVDPKGTDYAKYSGATVITPNAHDAGRAANVHVHDDGDLLEVARRLTAVCNGAGLLVTRGAAGMTLFGADGRADISAEAHEVYDVTGAGDTVVAVLAVGLGQGLTLGESVRIANAAAGIAVEKVGTATVTLEELEQRLAQQADRLTPPA
jgi:D-beta-D-heptose 7-phosphate kinase/D-beta-D-heptose 1-phosphate adenosyltransferase